MIYFCADDYGLCECANSHILQCTDEGGLNKISVFPNLGNLNLNEISTCKSIRLSLHLNLVEGKCMANSDEISLLADKDGNFINQFGGLFKLNILHGKAFEAQVLKEIRAQVLYWKSILPDGTPFCVDSHQHTHMIPAVFRALIRVLKEENIALAYMRIPAEPMLPFIKAPSLYFTYTPINIIKQWLLKALWAVNRIKIKDYKIPTALFFGILFSGKMDEKRVQKILPGFISMAEKVDADVEVLFHPGYLEEDELEHENKNVVFNKFYLSGGRKTEFDSVIKITKGSVR